MFVDTHCHLNMMVEKEPDVKITQEHLLMLENIVDSAKKTGVEKIITIGTSLVESFNSVQIAKHFDGVFACAGIHPCDCCQLWKKDFIEIENLIKNKKENKIVAVGETGLDFYHKPFFKQRQIDAFKAHIELSLKYNLPVVVHVRNSGDEVVRVLEEYKNEVKGVIHCFSQDKNFADIVLGWGMYIGINAPITYPKNEDFRGIVAQIPLKRILLETDAPFLPPQQFRGKQNSPAYIPIFAQVIADLHGVELQHVEQITTLNAEKLFGI